jgi:acetyl-CoA C-acetyltransferase
MCGSGLKAVMLAQQAISSGDADIVIAGGQESMSNAPFIVPGLRTGIKLGNSEIIDSLIKDGLWDVYNNIHMGNCAEACARDFNFTREQVDEFSIQSYKRAQAAQESKRFNDEIVPVKIQSKVKEVIIEKDEEPQRVNFEKIPSLKPVFDKNGILTAANSSKINDGAAALLLMSEETALKLNYNPVAEIIAQSSSAKEPINFTTAPADAIQKVLIKAQLPIDKIDLFEINEAFAVVSLAVNKLLGLNLSKVNINGGAIALGHPIGASGARILVTLLHEMKKGNLLYGLAALCIGGGEASAIIVKNYRRS